MEMMPNGFGRLQEEPAYGQIDRASSRWTPRGYWIALDINIREPDRPHLLRFSWFRAGRKNWRGMRIRGPVIGFVAGQQEPISYEHTQDVVFDVRPGIVGVMLDTVFHNLTEADASTIQITASVEPYNPLQALAMVAE